MRVPIRPLLVAAAALASGSLARRWIRRWGATDQEVTSHLPGDELVPEPHLTSTRAITIRAPAEAVFPWLAQLGQGRGGFYTYDWLENVLGLDIHSAERILPEFQEITAGDRIRVAPEPPFYGFVVADAASPSRLVLQMRINPVTGEQIEPGHDADGPSLQASWAFVLTPVDRSSTRLVARSRARVALPFGLRVPYGLALEAAEFVMEHRMLLGIRARAERNL